jgi:kynurenine formamidase
MMGRHGKRVVIYLLTLGVIVSIAGICFGIDTEKSDVVDLTRPMGPGLTFFTIKEAAGDEDTPEHLSERRFVFTYEPGRTETTALVSPRRWVEDGALIDDIPLSSLIVPVVVIDATDLAGGKESFALDAGTLMRYETFAGEIPKGAAVLVVLKSGDAGLGDDPAAPSITHGHPGLAPDAVRFLVNERDVSIVGIDTPGIDPSGTGDNEAAMILAKSGGSAVVNLIGVNSLPSRGGVLVLSPLAVVGADAAPVRALVLVPVIPEMPVE